MMVFHFKAKFFGGIGGGVKSTAKAPGKTAATPPVPPSFFAPPSTGPTAQTTTSTPASSPPPPPVSVPLQSSAGRPIMRKPSIDGGGFSGNPLAMGEGGPPLGGPGLNMMGMLGNLGGGGVMNLMAGMK